MSGHAPWVGEGRGLSAGLSPASGHPPPVAGTAPHTRIHTLHTLEGNKHSTSTSEHTSQLIVKRSRMSPFVVLLLYYILIIIINYAHNSQISMQISISP